MNRKIAAAVITCFIAGIGIYLVSNRLKGRKYKKRKAGLQSEKPKTGYAFEYVL